LMTFEPPPCTWFIRKIQKPNSSTNGRSEVSSDHHGDPPVPFESKLTPSFVMSFSKSFSDSGLRSDPEAEQQHERQERGQQRPPWRSPGALRVEVDALLRHELLEVVQRLRARIGDLRLRAFLAVLTLVLDRHLLIV